MTPRPLSTNVFVLVLSLFLVAGQGLFAAPQQPNSQSDFRQLLEKFAALSLDPCGPPYGSEQGWHSSDSELHLFNLASQTVTEALNTSAGSPASAQDRAAETLRKLEALSVEVNAAWPNENRFHFQILDLQQALVVKMTVRTHGTFFVFGVPTEEHGKPNRLWREVGSDNESSEHQVPQLPLNLYPLYRGPSGNPRFLARFIYSGCAGSIGVGYAAYEWNPKEGTYVDLIIKQEGSLGLDDKVPGFPQIGELKTEGPLITLPYCWFSSIDTWDNPSLCAVDTYDLSRDDVRFRSRAYNRPDLVPIAKAIDYAQQHDYRALFSYCASAELARRLVRDFPPHVFADEIQVTPTGNGKEHVKMLFGAFDVEKRTGRWVVVSFHAE